MRRSAANERIKNIAIALIALALIAWIIWLDVSTGVWSEVVILSGLAAGLVSFILTVMVLDKILARATAHRWRPVTRLAVSEFLHAIADEEHSEISRGHIVPRTFAECPVEDSTNHALLQALREQVVHERVQLTNALSRWANFLASSSDSDTLLLHIAEIAMQFDVVRDAALELEHRASPEHLSALNDSIRSCNAGIQSLESELQQMLEAERRAHLRRRHK